MKSEATKQLQNISLGQVKETLKRIYPDKFDKMILQEGQVIHRCNYVYVKIAFQKVTRSAKKIEFPLYSSIKEIFSEIEGGTPKHGDKSTFKSDKIINILNQKFSIRPEKETLFDSKSRFVYPLDTENNEISHHQRRYFFPDLTFKETCEGCQGSKYITCDNYACHGRHIWVCQECNGEGRRICSNCAGRKRVDCSKCNGSNRVSCKRCGGDGRVNDGFIAKTANSKYAQEKKCGDCAGKGYVQCRNCTNGQVVCSDCSGNGKISCTNCDSQGKVVCKYCYGDKDKFGKIDCPRCQSEGMTAQIVYVDSDVSKVEFDEFIFDGTSLDISDTQLKKHLGIIEYFESYKNINGVITDAHDEYSKSYSERFLKQSGLHRNEYPLLTKEDIYYQVIPCIRLTYKHMLTNSSHEFTIINFWNRPDVIFHSEPEEIRKDLGNTAKAVGGFFGKLFKTKGFKTKEDRRNEIVLLIHLAKADGKIEDQEKIYLSELIGDLDDFTNSEKQKLFDYLNSPKLPEITKLDVTFSSKERAQEVLRKLAELAGSDGEIEPAEAALIEKIRSMM